MNQITLIDCEGDGKTTACVVSLASLLANESFSDSPSCVCPIIRALSIALNDGPWWDSDSERTRKLYPLAKRIVNTSSTVDIEWKRSHLATKTAVRVFAPLALRASGRGMQAQRLESAPDEQLQDAISDVEAETFHEPVYGVVHAAGLSVNYSRYYPLGTYALATQATYYAGQAVSHAVLFVDKKQLRRELKNLILKCLEVRA